MLYKVCKFKIAYVLYEFYPNVLEMYDLFNTFFNYLKINRYSNSLKENF